MTMISPCDLSNDLMRERERERGEREREIERKKRGWGEGDRGEIADRIRDRRECGNFEEVFYLL